MKTFSFLVAALLLAAGSAHAQNLDRIGGYTGGYIGSARWKADMERQRQQYQTQQAREAARLPNASVAFAGISFEPLHRKLAGQPVSLAPLQYWRNAGAAFWEAYLPYPATNPLPQWQVVSGKVFSLRKDFVILGVDNEYKVLLNWPGLATALSDQQVAVVAVPVGPMRVGDASWPAFDFGTNPSDSETVALAQQDQEREAARAKAQSEFAEKAKDAAAGAEAKRKADIAARVEKARAEREAKEKPAAK